MEIIFNLKKIFSNFAVFLFVFLTFCLFLFVIVPGLFSGVRSFIVTSGSMEPTLLSGSVLYTMPKDSYKKDDVITFLQNGTYITHRIFGIEKVGGETFYITKGDSNSATDLDLVNSRDILGASVMSIPYIGEIILFLRSPLFIVAAIVLPAIIIYFYIYKNIIDNFLLVLFLEKRTQKILAFCTHALRYFLIR